MNLFTSMMLVIASLSICFAFYNLSAVLLPFFIAFCLSYFLDPVVRVISIKAGIARSYAIIVTFIIMLSAAMMFLLMLMPLLYSQIVMIEGMLSNRTEIIQYVTQFIDNNFTKLEPAFKSRLESMLSGFMPDIANLMLDTIKRVLQSSLAIVNLFLFIIIVPIIVFYMLKSWDIMSLTVLSLIPRRYRNLYIDFVRQSNSVLSGYIVGQFYLCLTLSTYYSITLYTIGINPGISIGLLSGFLNIIPYIGITIAFFVAILSTLMQFGFTAKLILVLAVFMIGVFMDGNILTPKIIGSRVGLHPVWILLGVFVGGYIGGLFGMFISFPLLAVLGVIARISIKKYRKTRYYIGY